MSKKFVSKLIQRPWIVLIAIMLVGFGFRFYGISWDRGYMFHPDERGIVMITERIRMPQNKSEYNLLFKPESPLNPNFFSYGSFPLYLLRLSSYLISLISEPYGHYAKMALVGRFLSVVFDLTTTLGVYFMGRKLSGKRTALLSSFVYAVAVLPIQLSHFYTVDTLLTMFVVIDLFLIILYYEHPSDWTALMIGIVLGLGVATKFSAMTLFLPVGLAVCLPLLKSSKAILRTANHLGIIFLAALIAVAVVQPYSFIDHNKFLFDLKEQSDMTKSAFKFPYTLQYVGKIPYLYEAKNIFFWGLGPLTTTLSIAGVYFLIKSRKKKPSIPVIILTVYCLVYFLMVGRFAIGFIRYMLPLYPFLSLCAGYCITLLSRKQPKVTWVLLVFLPIYAISFMHIYSLPTTHIQASQWIEANIPAGSTIATEDWDYRLPVGYINTYGSLPLRMYEPDTSTTKWEVINDTLTKSDYIVLASNRIYKPLMKLTDCSKLPENSCFDHTAFYYKRLFSGEMGYKKVAEFKEFPTVPLINYAIDDSSADEAFSVYDHPGVMIFKNVSYGKAQRCGE